MPWIWRFPNNLHSKSPEQKCSGQFLWLDGFCKMLCQLFMAFLTQVDADIYRKLGINLTSEPRYQTKKLFHG